MKIQLNEQQSKMFFEILKPELIRIAKERKAKEDAKNDKRTA